MHEDNCSCPNLNEVKRLHLRYDSAHSPRIFRKKLLLLTDKQMVRKKCPTQAVQSFSNERWWPFTWYIPLSYRCSAAWCLRKYIPQMAVLFKIMAFWWQGIFMSWRLTVFRYICPEYLMHVLNLFTADFLLIFKGKKIWRRTLGFVCKQHYSTHNRCDQIFRTPSSLFGGHLSRRRILSQQHGIHVESVQGSSFKW